jgi:hypothetical protein
MLPLFAMVALVSQAWAAKCTTPGNACQYNNGCFELSTEYSGAPGCETGSCTCEQIIANCVENGSLYSGVTGWSAPGYGNGEKCSNMGGTFVDGNNPDRQVIGCCKWDTQGGKCFPIYDDEEAKVDNCSSGANVYWDSACGAQLPDDSNTCPNTTPTYDGDANNCGNHYCKWAPDPEAGTPGGCFQIVASESETCADAIENCELNSLGHFTNDGCSTTPTISVPKAQGITVIPNGHNLHILSAKGATVSLYDMSGAKVHSGRVEAGNRVFSLGKVSSGSYYAIVQSGSDSKKIPVILK